MASFESSISFLKLDWLEVFKISVTGVGDRFGFCFSPRELLGQLLDEL